MRAVYASGSTRKVFRSLRNASGGSETVYGAPEFVLEAPETVPTLRKSFRALRKQFRMLRKSFWSSGKRSGRSGSVLEGPGGILEAPEEFPDAPERPTLERPGVRQAAEVALAVVVALAGAGREVLDGHPVLDVRQGAVEDPVLAVQSPAVEGLDHQLGVGGAEEPEGPGGVAAGDRLAGAGRPVVRVAELDAHLELPGEQAEALGVRHAGGGRSQAGRRGE